MLVDSHRVSLFTHPRISPGPAISRVSGGPAVSRLTSDLPQLPYSSIVEQTAYTIGRMVVEYLNYASRHRPQPFLF